MAKPSSERRGKVGPTRAQRPSVHFIGVSVVEDKRSFQAPLRAWGKANGVDLHFSGFGGLNYYHLPHLIDIVAQHHDLRGATVVLDVSSSRERDWFEKRRKKYDVATNDLLERIQHYGLKPIFLHFFRRDIDRQRDVFRDYLNGIATAHGIPVIDLADAVFEYVDAGGDLDSIFRDEVHTTADGADFYAERIQACFADVSAARPLELQERLKANNVALDLSALPSAQSVGVETRHGVELQFAAFEDGDTLEITLEQPMYLSSFLALGSPDAGYVAVYVDDEAEPREVACFDAFSYYPHVCLARIGVSAERRLRIVGIGKRPNAAALNKGDWSEAPRRSLISHLFASPRDQEVDDEPLPEPQAAVASAADVLTQFDNGDFADLASFEASAFRYQVGDADLKNVTQDIADRCVLVPIKALQAVDQLRNAAVNDFAGGLLKRVPERFFMDGVLEWMSPLTLETVALTGGVPFSTGVWLFAPLADAPATVVIVGRSLLGCYYHAENIFFYVEGYAEQARVQVRNLLRYVMGDTTDPSYFERARRGGLTPALVIGDVRPAHYLSQALNFLSGVEAKSYARLRRQNGLVIIVKDWCFIDPRQVFPEITTLPCIEVQSSDMARIVRDLGLRCYRFQRYGSRFDFSTVRRFAQGEMVLGTGSGSYLSAWICLDAERLRVHNQVELFSALLCRLDERARRAGKSLRVLWDGWTVGHGTPTAKDVTVSTTIREIAEKIRAASGLSFEEVELFAVPISDKIATGSGADVAFATYGTACLVPNVISGVPIVAYHLSKIVHDGGYTDPAIEALLTDDDVVEVSRHDQPVHVREFSVNVEAALKACDMLLDRSAG